MSLEEERKEIEEEEKDKKVECLERRNRRNLGRESDTEKSKGTKG